MATQQQRPREWTIMRADHIDEHGNDTGFRAAIENELASWEHVGFRLGRGLISCPIREEVAEGRWETTGWLFKDIFVPAAKTERQPVQSIEEPLPDLSEFDDAEQAEPAGEPQAA